MNGDPIVLTLQGKVPSKKNRYTPQKNGKGFFKNKDLQAEIDRLAIQVPAGIRDLGLIHPSLEFFFTVTKDGTGADRDSKVTCVLDILVQMGVLKDDAIRACDGPIVIHPSTIGEYHSTTVMITPKATAEAAPAPRYVDPRRKRRVAILEPIPDDPHATLDATPEGLTPLSDIFENWSDLK